MQHLIRLFSYIFHPLFIPFGGTLAYFLTAPRDFQEESELSYLLPIFILTVIVPILFYFILRNLKLISTIFAPTLQERKFPLLLSLILYFTVLFKIIPQYQAPELYFYFLGLILASLATLLLIYFKVKASIHLLGMGSLLFFLIALSINFEINITIALSLFTLATGLVTSSRLFMKAHTKGELLVGFLIGLFSQLLLVQFWL
ncbi:hypothetical protein [Croceivirga thetidis]|uniref:Transmembrane protein n=1 Tax=Croceivirga thetidis TaxID=2721623 RepID=A0ABX1GLA0_9FLAO|nr:hypothetical protein [Croceivirga thetidis]NKI30680.1 hypothetical protein [Croceivirga thetidis]